MDPALRATADRFIFAIANLKYMAASLPERSLERKVPGPNWTVRQVYGHIEHSFVRYAEMFERFVAHEELRPPDFDVHKSNAQGVAAVGTRTLEDILSGTSAARDRCIAAFALIHGDRLAELFNGRPLHEVLRLYGAHAETHALELQEALPELRFDPLVLNWLLYVEIDHDSHAVERQQRLLQDARLHYAREDRE